MAHHRKVRPGGLFLLPDGTAIRNDSDKTISLSKLTKEEVNELKKIQLGEKNENEQHKK